MSKLKFQSLKGMRDILGDDQEYMERIYKVGKKIADYYGFKKIETPVLEETELFNKGTGEDTEVVQKEMYSFKTKGGDKVSLRPEATPPIVRSYLEHGMKSEPSPTKLWYFGPMFRYEQPQAGRYRQFYQFGLETLREGDPARDAETIVVMYKILERLKIKNLVVEVNSIGDKCCRPDYVKALTKYLKSKKHYLCSDCLDRLKRGSPLRVLDCKKKKCRVVVSQAPKIIDNLCKDCHKHFKEVLEFLEELEIPYVLNPYLVRGLDYYTKTVFEIFTTTQSKEEEKEEKEEKDEEKEDKDEKKKEEKEEDKKENEKEDEEEKKKTNRLALGGGGRYDRLIKILGSNKEKNTPAVGAALGVDRIMELMQKQDIDLYAGKKPEIFLAQVGSLGKRKCLKLKGEFMKARMPILEAFGKNSLRSQLKIADEQDVKYTLILGQKEALDGIIQVRNMDSGKQTKVKLDKIVDKMKKKLK